MNTIDDDFVRNLAHRWHGLALSDAAAAAMRFDTEPSGFVGFLEGGDKA